MRCDDAQLSAFADGDLPSQKAQRVRAHLEACARCQLALAEIDALKHSLAAEADRAPAPEHAARNFGRVMERLDRGRPWRRARGVFTPWLAWTCAAGALLLFAGLGYRRLSAHRMGPSDDELIMQAESEFRAASAHYEQAIEKLSQVVARAEASWPPGRQRSYQAARAALDRATEASRALVRAHPADAESEALLFAAYRKELSFLQEELLRGRNP